MGFDRRSISYRTIGVTEVEGANIIEWMSSGKAAWRLRVCYRLRKDLQIVDLATSESRA